jgi:thioredoxin reductase
MAELTRKPHPPGTYPIVVVGSGPGGLQITYWLRRLGIKHAVISGDAEPGGMFLRFPLFQRLNTWSKPQGMADRGTRPYEWYDWNSLVAEDPAHRSLVSEEMEGVSYFPSRPEMAGGLAKFADRTGLDVRYGCQWESTQINEGANGSRITVATSDGHYQCRVAIFAVGMAEAWKPPIPGLESVPHYVDTRPAKSYLGRRVFIIGKRNSGFEVADALLPWARQIILASPRPTVLSVTNAGGGVRAKYLVPFEDHVIGGGVCVLDASIERVERTADGWKVFVSGMQTGPRSFEVDDVIAMTGFSVPLRDLPNIGVATFSMGRLPRMTHYWESMTVPGVFFAGTITQGAIGLRKHGGTGNSAAVGGFRHNARVLAEHLAGQFGVSLPTRTLQPDEVVPFLLSEVTCAPELLNQKAYLARILTIDRNAGIMDAGIRPLAAFVDESGPDAAAMAVETGEDGRHLPVVYVRHNGEISEHHLPPDPLLNFEGPQHRRALEDVLASVLR